MSHILYFAKNGTFIGAFQKEYPLESGLYEYSVEVNSYVSAGDHDEYFYDIKKKEITKISSVETKEINLESIEVDGEE